MLIKKKIFSLAFIPSSWPMTIIPNNELRRGGELTKIPQHWHHTTPATGGAQSSAGSRQVNTSADMSYNMWKWVSKLQIVTKIAFRSRHCHIIIVKNHISNVYEGDIIHVDRLPMKMKHKNVHGAEMKCCLKLNAKTEHEQMAAEEEMYNV